MIEIEVVLHKFVGSWEYVVGDDFADSFEFFEVANSSESAGWECVNDGGSLELVSSWL